MAPALGEGPERPQGPRQPRLGLRAARLYWACQTPWPRLHVPLAAARPPGRSRRWHNMPSPGDRMLAPARRYRRARPRARGPARPPQWRRRVSRLPEYIGHPGQHPSQPGPIVERPGQGLGLAQQGEAPPMLSQCGQRGPSKARRSSMASTLVSPSSGRCARAWRACSKEATASRNAARSWALAPACWQ